MVRIDQQLPTPIPLNFKQPRIDLYSCFQRRNPSLSSSLLLLGIRLPSFLPLCPATMRWRCGLGSLQRPPWIPLAVVCSAIIFCFLVTPPLLEVLDLLDQYDGYNYLASSLLGHGGQKPQDSEVLSVGDKIIVMASLESDDTSWVAKKLPEYA